ncbi:MAG TPA: STAS domain-containing protein [Phycisphaerales bacterium]|nr:STAS domain-containing protein [Phycisphaerales bacterium]HMP37663.1 STAS domain-containing protein [Phycisphaerales bacterium]
MPPSSVTVQPSPLPDGVLLTVSGDVDLARSPALRAAIATANASSPKRLVVDLAEVPYMDSSGVATLVEALQVARRRGSELILARLQPRVRSILEIARLTTIFRIVESVDDAKSA